MGNERRNIYEGLERDLRGFPVGDFVRAYAKAYFEADVETLTKLNALLGEGSTASSDSGSGSADIRAPLKPRPNLNSGAVALPLPGHAGDLNGSEL